jgi:hypothetical protein
MKQRIDKLPNWTFDVEEISMGVYRMLAEHRWGSRIDLTGIDPDALLKEAVASAEKMEKDLEEKIARRPKENGERS